MSGPLHLKHLLPDQVRLTLERDPRLLVPVGTCESHGLHLPLGCDTLIVERLADDLSLDFQILRAPTIEYGVNSPAGRQFFGNAAVRRKTLHRWMNDLIGSWERAGVDAFIILTAHGYDPHQEALSTLRTRQARVLTVDIFALDFTGQLDYPERPTHASELDTSLLLYVAPELVDMDLARRAPAATGRRRFRKRTPETESSGTEGGGPGAATREKGERLYKMIYERIATRVLESAA
jgi:creatinine amidohydrolase